MSGTVVWLTGLPASGKSTLAERIRARLRRPAIVLDSDEMRLAFEAESYAAGDRDRFYRLLANVAAVLARQDLVVLVAATAPRRSHREHARAVAPKFVELWVRASVAEAAARDVKGLYARARAGEITLLPGAGVHYEEPSSPEIIAEGGLDEAAVVAVQNRVE
ncbi:MAG: adenylylsulfate kinase [Myxococcales bacterium]|nr:adenylylsulfate kinase [Myxococcales bacterium]